MRTMSEERYVHCGEKRITYILVRKNVKNINLRIRPEGIVCVSAAPRVPADYIDNFVISKASFIMRAQEKYAAQKERHTDPLPEEILYKICRQVYPVIEAYGIKYPVIKLRTMKSIWGSCQPQRGVVTLNRRLLEAPVGSIQYVVLHEFAHFIYPNHSPDFHAFIAMYMPDWKERKKALEKIL